MLSWLVDKYLYQANDETSDDMVTSDCNGVSCLFASVRQPRRAIVYIHGSGMSLASLHESGFAQHIATMASCTVIAPELPGFGTRAAEDVGTGADRDNRTCESINKVLKYLRRNDVCNVAIVARSLGVGLALKTLNAYPRSCNNVSCITLISGFTSVQDMCRNRAIKPWLPNRLCNTRNIQSIPANIEVAIVHGTRDEVVPYEHATMLHSSRDKSQLYAVPNMQHCPTDNEMKHIAQIIANRVRAVYSLNVSSIVPTDVRPDAQPAHKPPEAKRIWWHGICPI